ncbi:hypothetical protein ANO11243_083010 [Dothideomycetidae sp. 11243]|nr:hypothetical protein ANO11243_083010 [fungal sp. No.11243]
MSKDHTATKRAASDSDGSEDVFLDLAQSDEEPDEPEAMDDEAEHTLRYMPGQFPERHIAPRESARPRSSGVQSRTLADRADLLSVSRHTRHVSQPMTRASYLNNIAASRYGRYADRSPAPDPNTSDTPRLRRQRNLYIDGDGQQDTRPTWANGASDHRTPRHFSVHLASNAQASPSSITNQAFPHDSDSADSQTAASTVWDELDDLKTRIRQLETSGRLPPTSNAAMASTGTGRPQTATTAPTTVSSSPKHVRKQSSIPVETTASPTMPQGVHPTLQSALARAKTSLKPHIYRPLEATIVESLALATMAGKTNSPAAFSTAASTVNGLASSDRQLRRKVDNLCRNLADLCIAICDSRSEEMQVLSSPLGPQIAKPISPVYNKSQLQDSREEYSTLSGDQSRRGTLSWVRLDNYRGSRGMSIGGQQDMMDIVQHSPEGISNATPRDYAARYSSVGRAISQDHDRRYSTADGGTHEDSAAARAPSRAMTELDGRSGLAPKYEHLRMGPVSQRSPSLRKTLEARRRSANIREDELIGDTQSVSGIGSAQTPAARRFLDRVRGGSGSDVGSTASSGPRNRLSSHEPYIASPRLTTPLSRATSLSNRRFTGQ